MIANSMFKSAAENPVLIHELRARMRGARAYWILLGYIGIIAVTMGVAAVAITEAARNSSDSSNDGTVGPILFALLIGVQAALIALIAPAVTSGAITLEREHQTFEMLASSRMNATTLIYGKLAASLGFLMLCLVCSMPVVFLAAAFGGLTPGQVVSSYVLLAIEAAVFGSIGLFWSAATRSTIVSTVLALPSVVLACIATSPCGAMALSSSNLDMREGSAVGFGVLGSLFPFVAGAVGSDGVPFFGMRIPFWLPGVLIGPLVVVLLCSLAAGRLDLVSPPRKSWALPAASGLVVLFTLFVTGGLLSPAQNVPYEPSYLWISLFVVLAVSTPFIVPPNDCTARSGMDSLRSARRGVGLAALWLVACAGIVVTGLACTDHLAPMSVRGVLDAIPMSLALIVSFLALETTLAIVVARAARNPMAGVGSALVFGGILGSYPLYQTLWRDTPHDVWTSLYLSPVTLPFQPAGSHLAIEPTALYACAALLFLLLTLLPTRQPKS